ncbi:MAG: hypothetical protein IJO48_03570 [Clostridia bacterium]|nr:hypothetical protein [Clostridia bacterium]
MGVFNGYLQNYSRPGPGVNEKVPQKGAKRYWHLLKNHFSKMVGVNLLYALTFIPLYAVILTFDVLGLYSLLFLLLMAFAPAIRTGCMRAMMVIARQGNCFVLHEFKKEFKIDFFKRLFASVCVALLPTVTWILFMMTGDIIGFGSAIGFTAIVFVIYAYLFPMLAITDISVGKCVKNAILLVMLEWKKSLLILLVSGVPLVICCLYLPFTLPILVMVLFALTWLFEAMLVNTALVSRGIIPEVQDEEAEEDEKEKAE